jgi:hypothetical protein
VRRAAAPRYGHRHRPGGGGVTPLDHVLVGSGIDIVLAVSYNYHLTQEMCVDVVAGNVWVQNACQGHGGQYIPVPLSWSNVCDYFPTHAAFHECAAACSIHGRVVGVAEFEQVFAS